MKEDLEAFSDIAVLPRTLGLLGEEEPRERRALLVARSGDKCYGIFADEADSVTEGFHPTPLPAAPPAVLGLVAVRGRMFTALSPRALLAEKGEGNTLETAPRFVLALRGDEQLALAVERIERVLEVLPEEVEPLDRAGRVVRGVLQHERDLIVVLDPAQLFEAAMQGRERRRRRT